MKGQEMNCVHCGDTFTPKTSQNIYCGRSCSWDAAQYKQQSKVPSGAFRLFERDMFRCFYCGQTSYGDKVKLTKDHLVPQCMGGDDSLRNLVTACHSCNSGKSGKILTDDQLAEMTKEINARTEAFEARTFACFPPVKRLPEHQQYTPMNHYRNRE